MPTPAQSAFLMHRAAELIDRADGIVITAGAGMGVDSGLPDFRGREGFWRAYPAMGAAGLAFEDIASPASFRTHPRLAWGFYGHRLRIYRSTLPHAGFALLRKWAAEKERGAFVFTSNVDGQFQKAGFGTKDVCEVHGSIHHLQCLDACKAVTWPADDFDPVVDNEQCMLVSDPPRCPNCNGLARPNVLMFGDSDWVRERSEGQRAAFDRWLDRVERPVTIECGAGTAIPSIRHFGNWLGLSRGAPLIRINAREAESNLPGVGLEMGALGALEGIERVLSCKA